MQHEDQFPASRVAAIEGAYSYTVDPADVGRSRRLSGEELPSARFRYRVVKRTLDIVFLLISLPVTLPILGIISVVVLLSTPGPVFYSHRRLGRNGAFFSMWKFRTMCENSAEVLEDYLARNPGARTEWSRTHKLRFDPRVTRVGRFLRRYSLDELPQIWNVFTGKMALVGPRPIVAAEVEKYAEGFRFSTAASSPASPASGRSPAAASSATPSASRSTATTSSALEPPPRLRHPPPDPPLRRQPGRRILAERP